MKFDQDLCLNLASLWTCDMNSTFGSVVPLAMFWKPSQFDWEFKTIAGWLQGRQRQDLARGVEAQEEVAGLPAGPHQGLFYIFAYFHYFFKIFFHQGLPQGRPGAFPWAGERSDSCQEDPCASGASAQTVSDCIFGIFRQRFVAGTVGRGSLPNEEQQSRSRTVGAVIELAGSIWCSRGASRGHKLWSGD